MFRGDVEGLRALAVFAVLLFHFDFTALQGGFIGVDIFFVISGYVISKGIYLRKLEDNFQLSDFYNRRFRRILPALMVTISLVLLAGFFLSSVDAYKDLSISSIYSALSLSNFYFAGQTGYFSAASIEKPLLHMWSLSVEEQFYLVWPLIFVTIIKKVRKDNLFLVLFVITMIFVFVSELWVIANTNYAFYMAPARFFEFLLGAGVVVAERKYSIKNATVNNILFVGGLVICLAAILFYNENMRFPGVTALMPALSVAVMIYSGSTSRYSRIFSNKIARFFGKISYSLYLVHWPIVVFYKNVYGYELQFSEKYGLLVMSVILAYLMWRYVEQPFRIQEEGYGKVSNGKFYTGLASTFFGVIVTSYVIETNQGFPSRLEQRTEKIYHSFKSVLSKNPTCNQTAGIPLEYSCFGDETKKSEEVILVGDSHVNNFLFGLSDLFEKIGLKGVYKLNAGCPPIRGVKIMHEAVPLWQAFCAANNKSWFKYAQEERIKLVVLAGRWAWYTSSNYLGSTGSMPQIFLALSPEDERNDQRSKLLFETKMESTIEQLVKKNKKILIFGQVPDIGFDVKRCLFTPKLLHLEYSGCSPVSVSESMENIAFTNKILNQIAMKYPENVLFLDSSLAFCDDECIYIKDDIPLYRDSNHLTFSGSVYIVQKFADEISAFIRKTVPGQPM